MKLVGYVRNSECIVPVIWDTENGTSNFFFYDGYDLIVVYGFGDLPIEEVPSAEIKAQMVSMIEDNLRGSEFCGFLWTSGDDLVGIMNTDYFDAELLPKKDGSAGPKEYNGGQVTALAEDEDFDSEYIESIMDALEDLSII